MFVYVPLLRFFEAAAKHLENIILLLAYTGLRKGDALELTWNNVDFDSKTITVERTRDKKEVRTPKTNNSYQTIRIDDSLIQQLKLYRTWCKQTLLSFGKHLYDDDFIFISYQSGTPMEENTLKYCFDRIIKKTGLKTITPHGLRHTHATILIGLKQPVNVIADRLGNTPQMIWDTYVITIKHWRKNQYTHFPKSFINKLGEVLGEGFQNLALPPLYF